VADFISKISVVTEEADETLFWLELLVESGLADYKPSSLIDFENGRPLELEAIWGEPVRRATAAGAKMPRLEELYSSLQALEGRNRPRQKVSSP
jgi:ketopantoate reductase